MDLEYAGFIHFGMSTFAGEQHCEPGLDPDLFSPTDLDCRQWAQVAKDAGMKMLVFTAKHHDGFCNWPSAHSNYTVAASRWRGGKADLVKECAEACDEAGLAFGLYLSPFDKQHDSVSPGYGQFYANQLRELLDGRYGKITMLWLDGFGAKNIGRPAHDLWLETARMLQPDMIYRRGWGPDARWGGMEAASVGDPQWCTFNPARGDSVFFDEPDQKGSDAKYLASLKHGDPDGVAFVPSEADPPSYKRHRWFWQPESEFEPSTPCDGFEQTVWNNAVLNRGLGPDRTGRIPQAVHDALGACNKTRARFLAAAQPVVPDAAQGGAWTGRVHAPVAVECMMLSEPLEDGQHIRAFTVEAESPTLPGQWETLHEGSTVGRRKLVLLDEARTVTGRVRVRMQGHRGDPVLGSLSLFPTRPGA